MIPDHVTCLPSCANMASNRSSLNVQKYNKYRYKTYVQSLNDRDALTLDEFKETKWSNYFIVDLTRMYKNGKANANHVFELFGSLNNKSASVVRQNLLQDVATEIDFYEQCSVVCLAMRSISLDTWVTNMDNEKMYCDELGLMGLSKMYGRHSVVLTKSKLWSTIDADAPFNLLELLQQCSVWFVYLGHLRFGSLVWKPRNPAALTPKTPAPSFKIIEEYTLDEEEQSSTMASAPKGVPSTDLDKSDRTNQTVPASVGTTSTERTLELTAESGTDHNKSDQTRVTAAVKTIQDAAIVTARKTVAKRTDSVSMELPVETSSSGEATTEVNTSDDLLLSQYPWTKTATIYLDKVAPLDIDIWTDAVHEYWCHAVGTMSHATHLKIPKRDGYVFRSKVKLEPKQAVIKQEIVSPLPEPDTKTEDLIKHAESLLERARQISANESRKRKHCDTLDVGTEAAPNPASRKFRCRLCKKKFYTTDELTTHHTKDHGIVKCNVCGKCFNTKQALSKHMNSHADSKWMCDECGKGFDYESCLLQQ